MACCFGSAACSLCCSACPSTGSSTTTRIMYSLMLLVGTLTSCFMLTDWVQKGLAKVRHIFLYSKDIKEIWKLIDKIRNYTIFIFFLNSILYWDRALGKIFSVSKVIVKNIYMPKIKTISIIPSLYQDGWLCTLTHTGEICEAITGYQAVYR